MLYLPAGKAKAQLSKWLEGIKVGLKDESEEAIVGTLEGCEVVRSVRRLSREDASDAVLFNSIKGSPWCLKPVQNTIPCVINIDVQTSGQSKPS